MKETAYALKPIVNRLKMKERDVARTDQSLVNAERLQTLRKAVCFFPSD